MPVELKQLKNWVLLGRIEVDKTPNPTVGIRRKRDEVPLGFGGKEEFRKLMTVCRAGRMGCPLQPKPGAGRASAIAERRPVF